MKYRLCNEEYKTVQDAVDSYKLMNKKYKKHILGDAIAWEKPNYHTNEAVTAMQVMMDFGIDAMFIEHVLKHMTTMSIFPDENNIGKECRYIGVND